PIYSIATMEQLLSKKRSQARFSAALMGLFAFISLALATVGIYGVISYSVVQRTQEMGIRIALGAQRSDILRLVLGEGMMLVGIGLGTGLAIALALIRVISSLLFGVSATDPVTFAAISGLLTGVAILACYIPARRATKVDPIVALRYE